MDTVATPATPRESKLVRGLNLLNCFHPGEDTLTLSQLAGRAGVPLPTAHRLVHELELGCMLERVDGRLRLGRSLAQLGRRAQYHLHTLFDDMLPQMVRLQTVTGLDVILSACYGAQVLSIGQLSRRGGTTMVSYAPHGSAINSALAMAVLQRHGMGIGADAPQVITSGEVAGVGAAIRPQGTAIRAVISVIGRDRDAVSAAAPHAHAVAQWFNAQLESRAPLAPTTHAPAPYPDTSSMLGRGLSLLNGLRAGETRATLTELAYRAGLPKSTAHRLISILIDYQFLQEGGRGIMFGPRILALSSQVPGQRLLGAAALPWQRWLCEQSEGISYLLVPEPPLMERLTCAYSDGPVTAMASTTDTCELVRRLSSAAAQAALREADPTGRFGPFAEEFDERARPPTVVMSERGYAVTTTVQGLQALAVPVISSRGTPDAALTLVTQALSHRSLRASVRAACSAAADLSRALAGVSEEPVARS